MSKNRSSLRRTAAFAAALSFFASANLCPIGVMAAEFTADAAAAAVQKPAAVQPQDNDPEPAAVTTMPALTTAEETVTTIAEETTTEAADTTTAVTTTEITTTTAATTTAPPQEQDDAWDIPIVLGDLESNTLAGNPKDELTNKLKEQLHTLLKAKESEGIYRELQTERRQDNNGNYSLHITYKTFDTSSALKTINSVLGTVVSFGSSNGDYYCSFKADPAAASDLPVSQIQCSALYCRLTTDNGCGIELVRAWKQNESVTISNQLYVRFQTVLSAADFKVEEGYYLQGKPDNNPAKEMTVNDIVTLKSDGIRRRDLRFFEKKACVIQIEFRTADDSAEIIDPKPDQGQVYKTYTWAELNAAVNAPVLKLRSKHSDWQNVLISTTGTNASKTVSYSRTNPNSDEMQQDIKKILTNLGYTMSGFAAEHKTKVTLSVTVPPMQMQVVATVEGEDQPINLEVLVERTDSNNDIQIPLLLKRNTKDYYLKSCKVIRDNNSENTTAHTWKEVCNSLDKQQRYQTVLYKDQNGYAVRIEAAYALADHTADDKYIEEIKTKLAAASQGIRSDHVIVWDFIRPLHIVVDRPDICLIAFANNNKNVYQSKCTAITQTAEEIESGAKQLYDLTLMLGDDEAQSIDYLRIQSVVFGSLTGDAKAADNFDPFYIYLDRQAPTVSEPETKYAHGWSGTRSFAFCFGVSDDDNTLGEGALPEEREGNAQINKNRDLSAVTRIQIGDLIFTKPEKGWGAVDRIEGLPVENTIEDPDTEEVSIVTAEPGYSIILSPVKNDLDEFEGKFNAVFVPDDKESNYYKMDLDITATDCCKNANTDNPETVHIQIDTFTPNVTEITVSGLADGKDGERVLQKSSQDALEIALTVDDNTKSSKIDLIEVQYGDCQPWIMSKDLSNTWTGTLSIPLENRSNKNVIKIIVKDRAGNTGTYYYTRVNNKDAVTPNADEAVQVVTDQQAPAQPEFPDRKMPDYTNEQEQKKWYRDYPDIPIIASDDGEVRSEIKALEFQINGGDWNRILLHEKIDAALLTPARISENLAAGKFFISFVKDSSNPLKFTANLRCKGTQDICIPVQDELFTLRPDGELTVSLRAEDFAGITGSENKLTFYLDNTAPSADKSFIPYSFHQKPVADTLFGVFYERPLHIKVAVSDSEGTFPSSGIRDAKLTFAGKDYSGDLRWDENLGAVCADFRIPDELPENSCVTGTVKITVTDNVGHQFVSDELLSPKNSTAITAENISPVIIEKSIDNAEPYVDKDHRSWYNGDVTVTYSVSDPDSGIAETAYDMQHDQGPAKHFYKSYTDLEEKTVSQNYPLSTDSDTDGRAVFHIRITDNAGNLTEDTTEVYKDVTAPYVAGFAFPEARSFESDRPDNIAEVIAARYGHFSQDRTKLIVTVRDDHGASAGISTVYCQMYLPDKTPFGDVMQWRGECESDGSYRAEFELPEGFKGDVAAWAADNVGNQSEPAFTDGFAAENAARHEATSKLTITLPQTDKRDTGNLPLYNQNVTAAVTVEDSFSGIRRVEWSTSDFDHWKSITIDRNGSITGDTEGWYLEPKDRNLAVILHADLTVTNDANGDFIRIRTEDNSGHISEEAVSFSIDKQAPHITVGGLAPSQGTAYYNRDITANVSVTERNFAAPTVNGQTDNGFTADPNTPENTDQHVHFKQFTYQTDGTYSLTVDAADLAGNPSDSPFNSGEFVIDKTPPKTALSIRSKNGGTINTKKNPFVSEHVTAEITVTELNFNPAGAVITINGQRYTPDANSWKTNQKQMYTLTVPAKEFAEDRTYTVSVSVSDLAGNSSGTETAEFIVDTVDPTVEISGVAAANKDKVAPVIKTADTNYNDWTISLTRNGDQLTMKQNEANSSFSFAVPGESSAITGHFETLDNGRARSFVFDDFPHAEGFDGTYELKAAVTDRAGRAVSKTEHFTVNRFGSVFSVTDYTEIHQKHLSEPQDIEIKERNVDLHKDGYDVIIIVDKGSSTEQLNPDQYTVSDANPLSDHSGYEYTYVIKADNFAQDLDYKVTIRTTDAADNTNVSTNRGAELDFTVDTHVPEFSCDDLFDKAEFRESEKIFRVNVNEPLRMIRVTAGDNDVLLEQSDDSVYGMSDTSFSFAVPASNSSRIITIELKDLAGNVTKRSYENLLVTENVALYLMHKTWVKTVGAIGAVGAAGAGALFALRAKRRKREE